MPSIFKYFQLIDESDSFYLTWFGKIIPDFNFTKIDDYFIPIASSKSVGKYSDLISLKILSRAAQP